LNVSGHMLIQTFCLVLVRGTCAQGLFAHFSHTLYRNNGRMINECGSAGGMRIGWGNLSSLEKIYLSATLYTTDPT
jgi:hypothetical protein